MNNKSHLIRLILLAIFFAILIGSLVWRVIDLTVIHRKFLQGQGNARSIRLMEIPAYRGIITDRNGSPLAVSTPVDSVWVNPKEFAPTAAQAKALAKLFEVPMKLLMTRINKNKSREFLYLSRQLPPEFVKKIKALKIPGINFQQEFKRYYPASESAAQLIGFTNIDDRGIEGIEFAYQNWLGGVNGKKRILKDRLGRVIEDLGTLKEQRSGNGLTLSIDNRIQHLAYHELRNTLEKFGAKSGSVVVLDSSTGEVLAAVNSPSFNPNARSNYAGDRFRNKAFTDMFEPGSVIKPFSIASSLGSGLFKPDTIIDTNPSWMVVNGNTIRDVHSYGVLNVEGVLKHSSNVGISKMVLSSPPNVLIDLLKNCGFGQRTDSGYPGESDGGVINIRDANPFTLATLGFGYGISVTVIQLAQAYSIFANKGALLPITLLRQDAEPPKGKQVINQKIAGQVLAMMESVLSNDGTGKLARVPGYRVAGKTGTARIAGKKGYEAKRHMASFVGIAPVSKPRITIAVIIHEPTKTSYYGAMVAAPLFSRVMAGTLRILDIPPDNLRSLS